MKKFQFRTLAAFAVIFALLAMSACGGNGGGAGTGPADVLDTGGGAAADEAGVGAADTGGAADAVDDSAGNGGGHVPQTLVDGQGVHPARNLEERTIRIIGWWDGMLPGIFPDDEPDPATAGNYFLDRIIFDNGRRIETMFNVTFEEIVLPWEEVLPTLTTSVMAGDPAGDVYFLAADMLLPAILGNLIQPINLINLPTSDVLGPQIYTRPEAVFNGNIYSMVVNEPPVSGAGLGVNLDIINAIGAPNPVDLFYSGEWNWSNFLGIMRTATMSTAGDGIVDQFGISGQPDEIALHLIAANDGYLVDANFNYAFDHPNTIEALEFVNNIFSERLWQHETGTALYDWGINFWAFQEGRAAFWPAVDWQLSSEPLAFDWTIVPFPHGPASTTDSTWSVGWRQSWTIPVGVENPEEALMIFEEIYSWSGDEPELMVEGQLSWFAEMFNTEEDMFRYFYEINATSRNEMGYVFPEYNWILGTFIEHMWEGTMGVSAAVEAYRGPQQELLDSILGR